jgi:hypothetical protein
VYYIISYESFSVTLGTILKSRSDHGMFFGRIFPLLWCMLCLEVTKGAVKMKEPNHKAITSSPANNLGKYFRN